MSDIVKRRSIRALHVADKAASGALSPFRNRKSAIGNQKTSDYCDLMPDT
jgi:hypothetical protein